jgi:hypothetical protein
MTVTCNSLHSLYTLRVIDCHAGSGEPIVAAFYSAIVTLQVSSHKSRYNACGVVWLDAVRTDVGGGNPPENLYVAQLGCGGGGGVCGSRTPTCGNYNRVGISDRHELGVKHVWK